MSDGNDDIHVIDHTPTEYNSVDIVKQKIMSLDQAHRDAIINNDINEKVRKLNEMWTRRASPYSTHTGRMVDEHMDNLETIGTNYSNIGTGNSDPSYNYMVRRLLTQCAERGSCASQLEDSVRNALGDMICQIAGTDVIRYDTVCAAFFRVTDVAQLNNRQPVEYTRFERVKRWIAERLNKIKNIFTRKTK